MGLLEFNKLPINTLVGADWKTFKAITAGREIDAAYKGKYRLTKAVCRLLSPLASLQDKRYNKYKASCLPVQILLPAAGLLPAPCCPSDVYPASANSYSS